MLRLILLCLAIVLGTCAVPTIGSARCLSYGPALVSLTGELTSRRVPGPPNYLSIARGDQAETIHILVLATPICVLADTASVRNSKSHFKVTEVQLVAAPRSYRGLLQQQVRATGTLFAAQTGHHRTPVLLTVKSLRKRPS